jgi:transcriptional regulator with PAS, ATPase and Fis domain
VEYTDFSWVKEFPAAITVTDTTGIILEMNDKAAASSESDGGRMLIGTNVLDCHPEPSRSKLQSLMDKQQTNIYTIEKKGIKKLIYQSPWFNNGVYAGFIEFSFEIPFDLPHHIKD